MIYRQYNSALSPTPPFSHIPRLRLAGLLLPIIIAVTVFHSAVFVKGATFCIGFALFGQPVITRGAHWLTHRYPNWREMLELRRYVPSAVFYVIGRLIRFYVRMRFYFSQGRYSRVCQQMRSSPSPYFAWQRRVRLRCLPRLQRTNR